jgi:hypothetical protein
MRRSRGEAKLAVAESRCQIGKLKKAETEIGRGQTKQQHDNKKKQKRN